MFRLASHRYGVWLLCVATSAFAQDGVQLMPSRQLAERLPESVRKQTPTFVFGDTITSRLDREVVVEGAAEIRKIDTVIRAKRIEYDQVSDVAKLLGDVRINQGGNRFWGPQLELELTQMTGVFHQPSYQFYKTGGQGSAQRINFVSERSAIAYLANYSTCKRPETLDGKPWKPDWILTADEIQFDIEEDMATASGATLRFQDVPLVTIPSASFPLSGARKSGLLAPTIASDSQSGLVVTQPVYWNISPNRDATLYPTSIGRRGWNYGGEFRYLEPNSMGTLRADYLPNDKLAGANRWAYTVDQRQLFRLPIQGASDVTTVLRLSRVSDDEYWRDLPNATSSLTQRLLNNELNTTLNVDGWATQFRVQRWQTLQSATSPITPPFDRTQLYTRRSFYQPSGLSFQFDGDITEFRSRPELTLQPNGTRAYALGQVSQSWRNPWGYLTPKLQWHSSLYQMDSVAASAAPMTQRRSVPIVSVDGGLFFERSMTFGGRGLIQTLEPRAFYVRTPYRDQSALPNYDSGAKDFSLATIYSENNFVGNDRISDMNMLTLGLTSKLIDPQTGAQAFSAGVAQRFSYIDQVVALPNTPAPAARLSDYLLSMSAQMYPVWSVDSTVQVSANSGKAERTTVSSRYAPSNYRSISAAYRMQQGVSEQVDINWQWPLGDLWQRADDHLGVMSAGRGLGPDRWYSVARFNYSLFDKRLVNAIAGFEYDADCWIGRIVLEKTQLDASTTNQRIMFQIEFSGFSRLGTSPLASLRSNIPRYQNLREQMTTPSRFSQYD